MIFVGLLSFLGGLFVVLGLGGYVIIAQGRGSGTLDASAAEMRLKLFDYALNAIQTGALLLIAAGVFAL